MSQHNIVSYLFSVVIAAVVSAAVVVGMEYQRKQSSDAPVVTRGDVETIARNVIDAEPQRIVDSVDRLFKVKQEEERGKQEAQVINFKDDGTHPSAGNLQGDVTIVEFFDYSCGFCKKVLQEKIKLLKNDANIKYVFMEFPILGPDSYQAARAALAVHEIAPDKYYAFHKALLESNAPKSPELFESLAKQVGVDPVALKDRMGQQSITDRINANLELGRSYGIRGTPAFVIGGKLVPGAIGYDKMVDLVKEARAKK